jgi:hypothetical protein
MQLPAIPPGNAPTAARKSKLNTPTAGNAERLGPKKRKIKDQRLLQNE